MYVWFHEFQYTRIDHDRTNEQRNRVNVCRNGHRVPVLIMLVVAINVMSALVRRYFPDAPTTAAAASVNAGGIDKTVVAAITAAVHHYRSRHK